MIDQLLIHFEIEQDKYTNKYIVKDNKDNCIICKHDTLIEARMVIMDKCLKELSKYMFSTNHSNSI